MLDHWSDRAECESPDVDDGRDEIPARCADCGRQSDERWLDGNGLCLACGHVSTDVELRAEAGVQ